MNEILYAYTLHTTHYTHIWDNNQLAWQEGGEEKNYDGIEE